MAYDDPRYPGRIIATYLHRDREAVVAARHGRYECRCYVYPHHHGSHLRTFDTQSEATCAAYGWCGIPAPPPAPINADPGIPPKAVIRQAVRAAFDAGLHQRVRRTDPIMRLVRTVRRLHGRWEFGPWRTV